ncbi:hypothetical protein EDD39_6405 [Kitasatospora cineracea]|uniref:Uncharacterized protein n=2 Tax=Kitasatospora cineracea TaxID=88074 RepID=A0A8G1UCH0_9ACTN|nr:hypothetical protein EDD39_6405 [Kitasatospora cineracea]
MPPRRVSLPGADELFRATGGMALSPSLARNGSGSGTAPANGTAPVGQEPPGSGEGAAPAPRTPEVPAARPEAAPAAPAGRAEDPAEARRTTPATVRGRGRARRPSGRERHDEKITVYVSAEELMDLEHARLVLRGEHGLAVDRGRVVREAVAVVLADLEQRGEASILVRRLRGR